MEPEPQPTTFSYPEPDQSDPHPLILLFRIYFNIIIPLRLFFQVISILPISSPKPCIFLASPQVQTTSPSLSFGFDHPHDIWREMQIMKLLIV